MPDEVDPLSRSFLALNGGTMIGSAFENQGFVRIRQRCRGDGAVSD